MALQAQELRAYLKGLGAEISEEKSPKGIEDDLHKIIGVCDACFREGQESEVESVLNDIVSIMVLVPMERAENIILAFCEKLTKAPGQKLLLASLRAYVLSLKYCITYISNLFILSQAVVVISKLRRKVSNALPCLLSFSSNC